MRRARTVAILLTAAIAVSVAIGALAAPSSDDAAEQAAGHFQKGNELYAAGDFDGAVAEYEAARAAGVSDPVLFFNLGNAYFKSHDLGRAILNYERGLRLAPRDPDLRFNLEYAQVTTVDKIEVPERTLIDRALASFAESVTLSFAVRLAVAFYVMICTAFLLAVIWRRRPGRRNAALAAAAGLLVVFLLYAPLLYAKVDRDVLSERAVLVTDKVQVRSGPGEEYTTLFTIHEGMTLVVRDVRGDWAQVTIPSGLSGWLPRSGYEKI